MSCRGVWFALSGDEVERLLAAESDDERISVVQEEIEDRWDEDWLCEADKAWDAIHRCLTDGTLTYERTSPIAGLVLGGRPLQESEEYVIVYFTVAEVQETAKAVTEITKPWFRERYFGLTDYDGPQDEDDFEYSWDNFAAARALFQKAAGTGRSIIFTVDQ